MTDHTEMQIPSDILEVAENALDKTAWKMVPVKDWDDAVEIIALAILAERERCARIAEENRIRRSGGWV